MTAADSIDAQTSNPFWIGLLPRPTLASGSLFASLAYEAPPTPPPGDAGVGPQELRDLLSKLLVRNPAYRLGSGPGGAEDIKRHPWFTGFDWAAFAAKKMRPPYVPKVLLRAPMAWGARRSVQGLA